MIEPVVRHVSPINVRVARGCDRTPDMKMTLSCQRYPWSSSWVNQAYRYIVDLNKIDFFIIIIIPMLCATLTRILKMFSTCDDLALVLRFSPRLDNQTLISIEWRLSADWQELREFCLNRLVNSVVVDIYCNYEKLWRIPWVSYLHSSDYSS